MNNKTVILNNSQSENEKAVVSLKENASSIIKFYNLKSQAKNLALGIKQDDKIVKIPLSIMDGKSEFFLQNKIDLSKNLLCAVVDISNAFCPEILLSGSNNTSNENENIEEAFVQKSPDDSTVLYAFDSTDKIEKIIDKNLEEDMQEDYFDACSNCKYREAFYSGCEGYSDNFEAQKTSKVGTASSEKSGTINKTNDDKNKNSDENVDEQDFFLQVKDQVEALFEKYTPDESLSQIIPNSKWVKVTYENENYYVLGLIYDDDQTLKYISYGVPSQDSSTPPDDLVDYAQWLPKDMNDANSKGYWIVCQDAKTGETLKIHLV